MNIGEKISSYRKKLNLSQEELAEMVDVTRQTISKWELEETTPDIKQAKKLSKIFNISLDELVDNDISSVVVEKVSNTEKLAGLILKILKLIGIFIIMFIVIEIIAFFSYVYKRGESRKIIGKYDISCTMDAETYLYSIEYNNNFEPIYSGGDAWIENHIDIKKYDDANEIVAHIEDYFLSHNGKCEVTNTVK